MVIYVSWFGFVVVSLQNESLLSYDQGCTSARRVLINSRLQDSTKAKLHVTRESRVSYRALSHFALDWSWETEKQYVFVWRMYNGVYHSEWYLFGRSSIENDKCLSGVANSAVHHQSVSHRLNLTYEWGNTRVLQGWLIFLKVPLHL